MAGTFKQINTSDKNLQLIQDNVQAALNGSSGGSTIPAGSILAYAGELAPAGYLMCDGSIVPRSQYPELFRAIGIAHGKGDGSTSFHLPDFRGRFLRGVDGSYLGNSKSNQFQVTNNDPDHATRTAMALGGNEGDKVGTLQGSAFGLHSHTISDPGHAHSITTNNLSNPSGPQPGRILYDVVPGQTTASSANTISQNTASATTGITGTASNGGNETRPVNAYVNWIIKV